MEQATTAVNQSVMEQATDDVEHQQAMEQATAGKQSAMDQAAAVKQPAMEQTAADVQQMHSSNQLWSK